MSENIELVVLVLLVTVSVLAVVARWIRVPYPILLVAGGAEETAAGGAAGGAGDAVPPLCRFASASASTPMVPMR